MFVNRSETANMTRFPNYRSNACLNWQPAEPFKENRPHASKLLKWLADWDGSPILIAEVQGQLGMKPGQWKEARKNAAVKEAFSISKPMVPGQKLQNQAF